MLKSKAAQETVYHRMTVFGLVGTFKAFWERVFMLGAKSVGVWLCIVAVVFAGLIGFPATTYADLSQAACDGIDEALGGGCAGGDTGQIDSTIQTVVNIMSVIAAIISVIMIIIGGFRYITSGGDSGSVSGAKNTIIYAVVGLIIVAFAQIIVRFTVGRVTP